MPNQRERKPEEGAWGREMQEHIIDAVAQGNYEEFQDLTKDLEPQRFFEVMRELQRNYEEMAHDKLTGFWKQGLYGAATKEFINRFLLSPQNEVFVLGKEAEKSLGGERENFRRDFERKRETEFAQLHRAGGDEISGIFEYDGEISFFTLDLRNFKELNDTLGHEQGNEALKQIGKAIRQVISKEVMEVEISLFTKKERRRPTSDEVAQLIRDSMRKAFGKLEIQKQLNLPLDFDFGAVAMNEVIDIWKDTKGKRGEKKIQTGFEVARELQAVALETIDRRAEIAKVDTKIDQLCRVLLSERGKIRPSGEIPKVKFERLLDIFIRGLPGIEKMERDELRAAVLEIVEEVERRGTDAFLPELVGKFILSKEWISRQEEMIRVITNREKVRYAAEIARLGTERLQKERENLEIMVQELEKEREKNIEEIEELQKRIKELEEALKIRERVKK